MKLQRIMQHMSINSKEYKYLKFISYDDIIIDILPPYNELTLMFLSIINVKCPKCEERYTKSDLNMKHPYQIVICKYCGFKGHLKQWYINTGMKN